jgi:gamma-glutamyltranspeptidase
LIASSCHLPDGVAPATTDPKHFDMAKKLRGPMAPTVPGALKGWEAIHQKCGTRQWAELWQDAINYAENGWPVDHESNFHIKRHIADLGIYETWRLLPPRPSVAVDGRPARRKRSQ